MARQKAHPPSADRQVSDRETPPERAPVAPDGGPCGNPVGSRWSDTFAAGSTWPPLPDAGGQVDPVLRDTGDPGPTQAELAAAVGELFASVAGNTPSVRHALGLPPRPQHHPEVSHRDTH